MLVNNQQNQSAFGEKLKSVKSNKWVFNIGMVMNSVHLIFSQTTRCVLCGTKESGTFLERTQNHRKDWIGRDLKDLLVPNPLPCAGTPSTVPGYSDPYLTWLQTLPGIGIGCPHHLWATCAYHPHSKEFLPYLYPNPTLYILKRFLCCPVTKCPCSIFWYWKML